MENLDSGYLGGNSEHDEAFNHFDAPKTDYSIQSIFYEEVLPQAPLSASMTQISFQSDASPYYTDLAQTKIELDVKILTSTGGNLPPEVAPATTAACLTAASPSLFTSASSAKSSTLSVGSSVRPSVTAP